jgi:hypothetical protein
MRRIRQITAKEKGFALCATALGCGVQSIGLISWTETPTGGAGCECDKKRKSIRLYNQKDLSSFIDRATRVSI